MVRIKKNLKKKQKNNVITVFLKSILENFNVKATIFPSD